MRGKTEAGRARARAVICALGLMVAATAPSTAAAVDANATDAASTPVKLGRIEPSALLTIDQNRTMVVERIVSAWADALASAKVRIDPQQLQTLLTSLRADQLLAASLAGSLEGLRNVIANALTANASVADGLIHAKALGDTSDDLVYTPVVPCRIVDSRSAGGPFAAGGETRNYHAYLTSGTFATQGGAASNCAIPANPGAVAINITAIGGGGFLTAWPFGTPQPLAATLLPNAGVILANGTLVPTCQPNCASEFSVFTFGAHLVIDIVGYFKAPAAPIGTISSVATGTGLTGGPITSTGTVSIANGGVNTTQLAANAVTQAKLSPLSGGTAGKVLGTDGTNLQWQADANSGGTVTQIVAGSGLTGGTITGSGTIALDPASTVLTATFFKQNGNAFGATAVLGTTDNHALELWANGVRAIRLEPGSNGSSNFIGGAPVNIVTAGAVSATIAGGGEASLNCGFLGNSTCKNLATQSYATVAGGIGNTSGSYAVVAGGKGNTASGAYSTVAGGVGNSAIGPYSTIPGGHFNFANADSTLAAGTSAYANYSGQMVFSDAAGPNFEPVSQGNWATGVNTFNVRATGGALFVTGIDGSGNTTQRTWFVGGNAFTTFMFINTSDRNSKDRFVAISSKEVLRKLTALPVTLWSYKGQTERHLGPTAQDFRAAFNLGQDDKTIGSLDSEGVALAAIQGLNAKVEQDVAALRKQIRTRDAEIAALRADAAGHAEQLADLRRSVEVLLARASPNGRIAQAH